MGVFRDLVEGMTASVAVAASRLRRVFASYPLSARRRPGAGHLSSNAGASEMSAWFPGLSVKATGRPQLSVRAWILVVGPPRDRPMA